MEGWSLAHYTRPYLVAGVRLEGGTVVLHTLAGPCTVQAPPEVSPHELAVTLEQLTNPSAPLWRDLREDGGSRWSPLVRALDESALLEDDTDAGADGRADGGVAADISRVASELRAECRRVGPPGIELMRRASDLLHRAASSLDLPAAASEDPAQPGQARNFFFEVLGLQAAYWRLHAPASLAAALEVMREIVPGAAPLADRAPRWTDPGLVPADSEAVRSHLAVVQQCLSGSLCPEAERRTRAPASDARPRSGLNLALLAERSIPSVLEQLGPSAFLARLADPLAAESLVRGYLIEDYYLTRRYIEAISPLLSTRLPDELQERLRRYYAEEIGHEAFTLRTAECCGIAPALLRQARGLPLRVAFIEILSVLAEREPISLFACLLVTEGFPAAQQPVTDRVAAVPRFRACFAAVGREHDEVNEQQHHRSLPRLLLRACGPIGPATQRRALERLAFMAELNHRSWESLVQTYAPDAASVAAVVDPDGR
jgi:hypothetical protein